MLIPLCVAFDPRPTTESITGVSATVGVANSQLFLSLRANTEGPFNASSPSLLFALQCTATGIVNAWENGVRLGQIATYTAGTVIGIRETIDLTVQYLVDGRVRYQSTAAATFPLFAQVAFLSQGASVMAATWLPKSSLCDVVTCPAQNLCQDTGQCVNGACIYPAKPTGTVCDDGLPSTVNDTCQSGACIGIDRCQGVVCPALDPCHFPGTCIAGS
jgi:hypothetical protein